MSDTCVLEDAMMRFAKRRRTSRSEEFNEEMEEVSDCEQRRSLEDAMMRLAKKRMESLFSAAIQRFEFKYDEVYKGQAWDFRWGQDCQLYHWREFEDFYHENGDQIWHGSQKLLAADGAFIIPSLLIIDIAKDL